MHLVQLQHDHELGLRGKPRKQLVQLWHGHELSLTSMSLASVSSPECLKMLLPPGYDKKARHAGSLTCYSTVISSALPACYWHLCPFPRTASGCCYHQDVTARRDKRATFLVIAWPLSSVLPACHWHLCAALRTASGCC